MPAAVALRRRVRLEMRSEHGFAVGGAGESDEAGADVVGPVVSTESVPCVGLLEGVGCGSRGFCGARADLGGYGEDRSEIVVGCRQSPPAAGTVIDPWRR